MSTDTSPSIAVLGTGLIGAPVARNLRKRGFTVRAWNRTAAKAQALVDDGVETAAVQASVQVDVAQAGLWRFERALGAGHGNKDMAASYLASENPTGAVAE